MTYATVLKQYEANGMVSTSWQLFEICTDVLQDPERQKETEELLGPIGDDKFTYLKDVGKLITDFSQPDDEPGPPGDTLDDDIGVAVEFDADEDADEENEVDEVEVRRPLFWVQSCCANRLQHILTHVVCCGLSECLLVKPM